MQLTHFTDYSLRVLIYLGLKGKRATVAEIASAYRISRNHLVKVVHLLSSKGYISTSQGPSGGLQLSRSPENIRMGDVILQTEPNMNLVECFNVKRNTCPIIGVCQLEELLYEAREKFVESLNQHTLADLLAPSANRSKRMRKLGLPLSPGYKTASH